MLWGSESGLTPSPKMKAFLSTVATLLPLVTLALADIPDKIFGVNLGSWYRDILLRLCRI